MQDSDQSHASAQTRLRKTVERHEQLLKEVQEYKVFANNFLVQTFPKLQPPVVDLFLRSQSQEYVKKVETLFQGGR